MAVPVMHPEITMRIAEDRVREMIETSAVSRQLRAARRARRRRARRRAGWALVGLGLRLALSAERPLRP